MPLKSKPKKEKLQASKDKKEQKDNDNDDDDDEELEEDEVEVTSSEEEEFEALGPYAITSNQINSDNPQEYHEIFHTKLKHSTPFKTDQREVKELHNNVSSHQSTSSANEKNSRTDDLIKCWKRFAKQESIMVKRLKDTETLLKSIFFSLCEIKKFNSEKFDSSHSHDSKIDKKEANISKQTIKEDAKAEENEDHDLEVNAGEEEYEDSEKEKNMSLKAKADFNYSKYSKQIKKSLYSVALLLGVNIDLISESISSNSSNNSETLDNHIKKIHSELVSMKLKQHSTLIPLYITNQIDPNSITLLNFMYENLKTTFHNQFNNYKLQKKHILNKNFVNWSSDAFNTQEYLSKPVSDSEMRSSNNTTSLNDYDDSSTYLFDSPTISFASNEDKNKKKSKVHEASGSKNNKKSETISSDSNNSNIISIKRLVNSSKKSNSLENLAADSNKPKTSNSLSPSKTESIFDDSLCVKIMQNYIDVFGNKDHPLDNE
jgi:hypothetical protein